MSGQEAASGNGAPKGDGHVFKFGDRSSCQIVHAVDFKPIGRDGVESFFKLIEKHAKQAVVRPVDTYHMPNGKFPNREQRYCFKNPKECDQFIKLMDKLEFSQLKITSILYVDLESSHHRIDNSSVRIEMKCESGVKTTRVIKSKTEKTTITATPVDPYRKILEKNDRNKTPPPILGSTPMPSPNHSEESPPLKKNKRASLPIEIDLAKEIEESDRSADDIIDNDSEQGLPISRAAADAAVSALIAKMRTMRKEPESEKREEAINKINDEMQSIKTLLFLDDEMRKYTENGNGGWEWEDTLRLHKEDDPTTD